MAKSTVDQPNMGYIFAVSILSFILPIVACGVEHFSNHAVFSYVEFGKWFIFFAAGSRLLIAGIRQIANPGFTAKSIFHIEGTEAFPILRELGFANICAGLVAILSLFLPDWRVVSAFGSGVYYGMAAILHSMRKGGVNEKFALITDLVICILLLTYFIIALK